MSTVAERKPIGDAAADELQASFGGELVRPGDDDYDEHRKVWNGSIDRRPGSIARCAGVADVRAAVALRPGARTRSSPCAAAATASPGCRCATTACSSTSGR